MKVRALMDIPSARGTIPAGQIIEINESLLEKLQGKVEPVPADGKALPHYCSPGDCWCSEKLPGAVWPAGCIQNRCEHYRPPAAVETQPNLL